MLDTGAEPNLIKKSALKPETQINMNKRLTLQVITEGRIETLGSTHVSIAQTPVEFHIVPDSFPVTAEGLLGSSFCSSGITISYPEQQIKWGDVIIPFANNNITIPARSVSCMSLRANPPIAFLSHRKLAPGIFVHNSLVRCEDGRTTIQCVNTSDEPRVFPVPMVELEEVESISSTPPAPQQAEDSISRVLSMKTVNDRVRELKDIIHMEHLNDEEREHVAELIETNCDLFHLPGDPLGKTSAVTHKIQTTDDVPIHTKHTATRRSTGRK